jgi:hypothetical protein
MYKIFENVGFISGVSSIFMGVIVALGVNIYMMFDCGADKTSLLIVSDVLISIFSLMWICIFAKSISLGGDNIVGIFIAGWGLCGLSSIAMTFVVVGGYSGECLAWGIYTWAIVYGFISISPVIGVILFLPFYVIFVFFAIVFEMCDCRRNVYDRTTLLPR